MSADRMLTFPTFARLNVHTKCSPKWQVGQVDRKRRAWQGGHPNLQCRPLVAPSRRRPRPRGTGATGIDRAGNLPIPALRSHGATDAQARRRPARGSGGRGPRSPVATTVWGTGFGARHPGAVPCERSTHPAVDLEVRTRVAPVQYRPILQADLEEFSSERAGSVFASQLMSILSEPQQAGISALLAQRHALQNGPPLARAIAFKRHLPQHGTFGPEPQFFPREHRLSGSLHALPLAQQLASGVGRLERARCPQRPPRVSNPVPQKAASTAGSLASTSWEGFGRTPKNTVWFPLQATAYMSPERSR